MTVVEEKESSSAKPLAFKESVFPSLALVGNPNTGKSVLFSSLTGLRAKAANYGGTTVELRKGRMHIDGRDFYLYDLPGLYNLQADTDEERVTHEVLTGQSDKVPQPAALMVVVDATKIRKNLFLVRQIRDLKTPCLVVVNMIDAAQSLGVRIDVAQLEAELGCSVVAVSARTGYGMDVLREKIVELVPDGHQQTPFSFELPCMECPTCPFQTGFSWSHSLCERCVNEPSSTPSRFQEAADRLFTHPVWGLGIFSLIMLGLFYVIFQFAQIPMDFIDQFFAWGGEAASRVIPEGALQSLVVDGLIAGIGGLIIFVPQIALLFFLLTLLEDSGYLARAVVVMDRMMRWVGLPGSAFIPLLSAHACAIPAIMSTRVIRSKRDRFVTILIAPLLTCSARVPVYVMLITLMLPGRPVASSLVFMGAYACSVLIALAMAWIFRHTILPGKPQPLVIELPDYRMPQWRVAFMIMWEKVMIFIKKAGGWILLLSVGLWVLATYPQPPETGAESSLQAPIEYSVLGRVGKAIEPVVKPLGYDWQIGIGILSSFAAREVMVSTLAVIYGVSDEGFEEGSSLFEHMRAATHADGSPVYTVAACLSLLVFFMLAMQCLPTTALTKSETGSWKWALLQLAYMTILAYSAAFLVYQSVHFVVGS